MVNTMDSGGGGSLHEMERFLPQDGTNGVIKYQNTSKADMAEKEFDPFAERDNKHPTTYADTLIHLCKSALGTGILAMPIAFMYVGCALGISATIFCAIICTHCAYILVKCAHRLYYKLKRTKMTFAEVTEISFQLGPTWTQKIALPAKYMVLFCLFLTYFGTCSVYTVIVASNFQQVIEYFLKTDCSLRTLIAILLIPSILLTWVPNLKFLAPISMIANCFMAIGLGITVYYLVQDLAPLTERDQIKFGGLPPFFAITIFALEAIGVILPLENNMKDGKQFVGWFGILNIGMFVITVIYMTVGLLGYLRYGTDTAQSITLNLPLDEVPAQTVKVLVGLAVFCTFGLQFVVCLEIAWDSIKKKCTKRPVLSNYVLRTFLSTSAVLVAIAVPTIAPFMGLIGAFCFSILGIIFPMTIELILRSAGEGFGKFNWIVFKNIFVIIFGFFALIFGTKSAILEIAELYK